jgi:predicted NUDIX family phosphoesterase
MDKANERVLVVARELLDRIGPFQGFTPQVERYLPALLDPAVLQYLPRSHAETDPTFKQLIPYVVLRWRNQVYFYRRSASGTEARLRSLRSLGIGGHICFEDSAGSADPYRTGLLREVSEEVQLDSPYQEHSLGLINDDRTPVGQVHLGIVHVFDLAQPRVSRRDPALVEDGFAPVEELRQCVEQFETWSQLLLEGDRLGCKR